MKNKQERALFISRITTAHIISYFIAGILASSFLDYNTLFSSGTFAGFMRPTTSPMVALGPSLQIVRGIIMALALLPFRKIILADKNGFLKLALLIAGLSVFSTFAAATGSVDGFIFTQLSIKEHIIGYLEAACWIFLFCSILWIFYKYEKKGIDIAAVIIVILIILMGIAGYFAS